MKTILFRIRKRLLFGAMGSLAMLSAGAYSAPSTPTVTQVGSDFKISWTSSNDDWVVLDRSFPGCGSRCYEQVYEGKASEATDKNVVAGISYRYKVHAAAQYTSTPFDGYTKEYALGNNDPVPSIPTVTQVGSNFNISWTGSNGVWVALDRSFPGCGHRCYEQVYQGRANQATDSNVIAGVAYQYRVHANGKYTDTPFSGYTREYSRQNSTATAPSTPSVTQTGPNFNISWTGGNDDWFILDRSFPGCNGRCYETIYRGRASETVDTNVSLGVAYRYKVHANGRYTSTPFDGYTTQYTPRSTGTGSYPTESDVLARNTNPAFTTHKDIPSYGSTSELNQQDEELTYDYSIKDSGPSHRSGGFYGDGNFRVSCEWSHYSKDDPIVKPGEPGKSHLHLFFGSTETDAFTTDAFNLTQSGGGTCNGFELNRSAYWTPAMLDAQRNIVIPSTILAYYKTQVICPANYRPNPKSTNISDYSCVLNNPGNNTTNQPNEKPALWTPSQINKMPQGLQLIGGNADMTKSSFTAGYDAESLFWSCGENGIVLNEQRYSNIPTKEDCTERDGNGNVVKVHDIAATISFPQCMRSDGALRSDNPSDLMAHVKEVKNYTMCPAEFPRRIPKLTILLYYPHQDTSGWVLSSDLDRAARNEGNELVPGGTLHADWIGGWDETAQQSWLNSCLKASRNCTFGETGTNRRLKWKHNNNSGYSAPYSGPLPNDTENIVFDANNKTYLLPGL